MIENYFLVEENVDLKKYNTYKIGGKCKFLLHPYNKNFFVEGIKLIDNYYILGNGSNVIFPDEDYNGSIIIFDKMCDISIENDVLSVEAGIKLNILNEYLLKNGYVSFSWSYGIPSTIGGAIKGNAGAYGHDTFENLISVEVLQDGIVKELKKDEIVYSYRFTNIEGIILSAKFKVVKGDVSQERENIKNQLLKRKDSQPLEYPNAGSVFKNPEGDSAGRLIDSLNLKGYKIGGAMISHKHANFIVNTGNATSKDIQDLINYVKKLVKNNFNIELELEQKIVKW